MNLPVREFQSVFRFCAQMDVSFADERAGLDSIPTWLTEVTRPTAAATPSSFAQQQPCLFDRHSMGTCVTRPTGGHELDLNTRVTRRPADGFGSPRYSL